jgi:Fic family protein
MSAGREVAITWNGRRARAWVPERLSRRDLSLGERAVRATERAAALARRVSDALPAEWEPLARLLLRSEGIASSAIEGVRAPVAAIAAAELEPAPGDDDASWIAGNLAAVRRSIGDAHRRPLDVAALNRWHRALMSSTTHLPRRLVGRPRDAQGWIGGTSPLDAALVTPPPGRVGALLDDLVAFANRTDVDAVTQAAAVHAQFETIHPYADGNGRVGRVLAGWVLTRRLQLVHPPPLSVAIARDRGGYLSGLTLFRLGDVDPWVEWFADVVAGAAEASIALLRDVEALEARWDARLARVRVDATARRVVPLLPSHPVLAAPTVAEALDISERAARSALTTLGDAGIVRAYEPAQRGRGRPRRWWVAHELLDLVTEWAR